MLIISILKKKRVFVKTRFLSDPAGIQTLDLQNRNLTLYSAKLRGLVAFSLAKVIKRFGIRACSGWCFRFRAFVVTVL